MGKTKIEWATHTWNPIVGCTKVSEACENCYAISTAAWIQRMTPQNEKYKGTTKQLANGDHNWTGQFGYSEKELYAPLKWTKPRRVFVGSMTDMFHPEIDREFLLKALEVMRKADKHIFMLLTKRPDWIMSIVPMEWRINWPRHVWIGTTVETQERLHERSDSLIAVPSTVRFLSIEPLLGPVDLSGYEECFEWVIVGGESGPKARPMNFHWVECIRDWCEANKVPFFFKQWGEWMPVVELGVMNVPYEGKPMMQAQRVSGDKFSDATCFRVGRNSDTHTLDGNVHQQFPDV